MSHYDLQFRFDVYQQEKLPQWQLDLGDFLRSMAPFMRVVFWVLVIAAVVALAYFIGREIVRRGLWKRDAKPQPAEETQWRPAPELARNLLSDADMLAAEGRYGDAVHLILLRSIEHIDERKPETVKPALTSREIGALGELPSVARATFQGIARVVERALFAGRAVSYSDFKECREAYERFAFPASWEPAR
jgi:hypothetical protein